MRIVYLWSLRCFFCFVAGISSSLSFLSSSLLKFPILQHPGTAFRFVAEIPSCNVSPASDTLARFWNHWYSSLVNSVIFLFVSAISSFPANLIFRSINGSLYLITDLPLNYRLSYLFLLPSLQFLQHVYRWNCLQDRSRYFSPCLWNFPFYKSSFTLNRSHSSCLASQYSPTSNFILINILSLIIDRSFSRYSGASFCPPLSTHGAFPTFLS